MGANTLQRKVTISVLMLIVMLSFEYELAQAQSKSKGSATIVPEVVGDWWIITGNPDIGTYNSPKQQPVDFGVWQAADGTFQLWSCIRYTNAGGNTRLFYRWEGGKITDKDWAPKGIAMESDTALGEAPAGLQAPFVLKDKGKYYMFYGDWERICLAESKDGKQFVRVLKEDGDPSLFSMPDSLYWNSRDPMVLKIGGTFYCYYCSSRERGLQNDKIKSTIFCRTSKDLKIWSEPFSVARGGKYGNIECPFVVHIKGKYILFRNHIYGQKSLNTQYCSPDPLNFGIDSDIYLVSQIPYAAPEIIKVGKQYYIVALKPTLDGMMVAKLRFVKKST